MSVPDPDPDPDPGLDDPPVILRRQRGSEAMFLIGGVMGLLAAVVTALAGVDLAAWCLGARTPGAAAQRSTGPLGTMSARAP